MPAAARRNALFMAASQGARLLGPGLALIVLAAQWTPQAYGQFASLYALASLLALLPAAGLSAYLLDRSARNPAAARAMLRQAGWAQCLAMLPGAVIIYGVTTLAHEVDPTLAAVVYLVMLLAGFCEIAIASLRAHQSERPVALVAVPANAALLVCALAFAPEGPLAVAGPWAAIRVAQLLALMRATRRHLPQGETPAPPIRQALPFFWSQSAGVAYNQVDTLLVFALLGDAAAGLYNAALRLLQLGSQAAQTLAQWFQPRLAVAPPESPEWLANRMRLRACLAVVAGGGLAGFTLLGEWGLETVFGAAYLAAYPTLVFAGAVLVARCLLAALWMELTARRQEAHRARNAWLLVALFAILAWPLTLAYGPNGAMLAHLIALGPIAAMAWRTLAKARQHQTQQVNPFP